MRVILGLLTALSVSLPLSAAAAPAADRGHQEPTWQRVDVKTDQQFRGLDAVNQRTAWVGGSAGGVWRTTDGGRTWSDVSPPGAEGLLFRDVEASDARRALVMSIGEGTDSRIYRTTDGGKSWTEAFVNDDPAAFYDCMAMWPDGRHGLAMSDPVDGKFRIISTRDGGASWQLVDPAGMPPAVAGEAGFAASGTCLVTGGPHTAYLGSGGAASRIFVTHDRGQTWQVSDSTIPAAAAGGVFSIASGAGRLIAVGGDFTSPDNGVDMSAWSTDGQTWHNGGDLSGYRSGVDWLGGKVAIAVGPTGSDITTDAGRTWQPFSDLALDAVRCVSGSCWGSGPKGVVVRLVR